MVAELSVALWRAKEEERRGQWEGERVSEHEGIPGMCGAFNAVSMGAASTRGSHAAPYPCVRSAITKLKFQFQVSTG
jgi:hypothetical protein